MELEVEVLVLSRLKNESSLHGLWIGTNAATDVAHTPHAILLGYPPLHLSRMLLNHPLKTESLIELFAASKYSSRTFRCFSGLETLPRSGCKSLFQSMLEVFYRFRLGLYGRQVKSNTVSIHVSREACIELHRSQRCLTHLTLIHGHQASLDCVCVCISCTGWFLRAF